MMEFLIYVLHFCILYVIFVLEFYIFPKYFLFQIFLGFSAIGWQELEYRISSNKRWVSNTRHPLISVAPFGIHIEISVSL